MHTEFLAHIRAHAYALVGIARKQSDHSVAIELEALAIDLLRHAHEFENHQGSRSKS